MRLSLLALLAFAGCAGRSIVVTPDAPAAIGPYAQGVRVGDRLYVAGQIGLDPVSGQLVEGGIVAETQRALENARAVLTAAGFILADVVQVTVYLVELEEYAAMNEVYARFFSGVFPARAAVEVAGLPRGARVEIVVVAEK